jgi:hypothetical protein
VLDDVRRGRLRVRTEDAGLGRAAERLGRRIALGVIGATLIGAATALRIHGDAPLSFVFFVLAAVFALLSWGTVPQLRRKKPRTPSRPPRPS